MCICCECYAKRSKKDVAPGCNEDHEYLELGGQDWRDLGEDEINAEGQSLWEWICLQREKYRIEEEYGSTARDSTDG